MGIRKSIVIFFIVLSLFSGNLFAGGDQEAGESGKKVLEFSTWEVNETEFLESVIEGFEALNPDIEIKLIASEAVAYKSALQVALGSDDPPDMFMVWSGDFTGKLVRNNQIFDLSEALDSDWGDKFSEASKAAFAYDGKYYAAPYHMLAKQFYYNKEHFAEAGLEIPETWDELLDAAYKVKENGHIPIAIGGADSWQLSHYIAILNQKLVGMETLDKDYYLQNDKADLFTDPGYVEALNTFKDIQNRGLFVDNATSVNAQTMQALFYSGQASMMYGGSWNINIFDGAGDSAPPEFKEKYGLFRTPAIPGAKGDQNVVLSSPDGTVISNKTPYYDEAVAFVAYLSSYENQQKYVEMTGNLSCYVGALNEDNAPEKLNWVANEIASANAVVGWMDTILEASINEVYLNGMVSLFNGSKSAEEVMAEVQAQAQIVYDEFN